MKHLKYYLLIMILLLVPNVYALEVDVTNSITSPETSGTGKYRGTEILNTGGQFTYNVKTRYQGRLSRIIYNLPLPSDLGDCFTTNATYTVTMYMETNDWNNKFGSVKVRPYSSSSTNWSNGNVTYVSYKKIYFTFKIPSSDTTCYDFVWIDLPSTNLSTTGITQISNWNLNKITLTDPTISSGGSGGSGSTPTPTPDSSQAIINNQNQNTQSIIENQDSNTEDIISSIQETTQQVSDTITNVFTNKCNNLFNYNATPDFNFLGNFTYTIDNGVFTFNGTDSMYKYIGYNIYLKKGDYYWGGVTGLTAEDGVSTLIEANNTAYYCFNSTCTISIDYDQTINFYPFRVGPVSFTANNFVVKPFISATDNHFCPYGGSESNKIDFWGDNIDSQLASMNATMQNDNIDDKTGFFTNFQDNTHGLTGIITAPLTTIQGLANTSCSPLSIPIPYTNSNVSLPCMTQVYQTYVPTVFNLWQVVSFGIISYFICIDIFKMVKGFKDPNEDKVEVLDL